MRRSVQLLRRAVNVSASGHQGWNLVGRASYYADRDIPVPLSVLRKFPKHSSMKLRRKFLKEYPMAFLDHDYSPRPTPCPEARALLYRLNGRLEDIESSLSAWVGQITEKIVEDVLRDLKNMTASILFFNWARKQPGFVHTTHTHNCLIDALLAKGYQRQALRFYELHMLNRNSTCPPNSDTIASLVRSFASAMNFKRSKPNLKRRNPLLDIREIDEAVQIIDNARNMGIEVADNTYHRLVLRFCIIRKPLQALHFYKMMKEPKISTSNELVMALCRGHKVLDAYELIISSNSEVIPVKASTYHMLIETLCKKRKVGKAYSLLLDMISRDCTPTALSYNLVINGLCDRTREENAVAAVDEAYRLFEDMEKRNVIPNVYSYSVLVQGLCNIDRVEDGERLFGEMLTKKYSPDQHTSQFLINGLLRRGRLDDAKAMLVRMNKFHCKPSHPVIRAVIDALIGCDRIRDAVDTHREMLKGKPLGIDLVAYRNMIVACAMKGMMSEARVFVDTLSKGGFSVSDVMLRAMVIGYCDTGRLDDAAQLFEEKGEGCCDVGTLQALVIAYCKQDKMKQACKILEKMFAKDSYPSSKSPVYEMMIDGLRRTGNDHACDILQTAYQQSKGRPSEDMFKAVFRLKSCLRNDSHTFANKASAVSQTAEELIKL